MKAKSLGKGDQVKLTTTDWHLIISAAQLKTIVAVTRGFHRFSTPSIDDEERMQLMKKAAVRGGLRVSFVEKRDGNHQFYLCFDKDYFNSFGVNVRGEYCVSQSIMSTPDFNSPERATPTRPKIPEGTPTFNARRNWEWLKKFLQLK